MFTILHISDLHRSPSDPISNTVLMSSLIADHAKYTGDEPPCPSPDAIIVSGDIIQGVRLGTPDAVTQIRDQYETAAEFLGMLVDRFLDGDRSRLVIVPGNHDVDWNAAHSAMEVAAVPPARPGRAMFRANPLQRWSWESCQFYNVTDQARYENRLAEFRRFYSDFYGTTTRRLAVSPYGYWDLFELHDGRIVVAAFNSCANNDCFRFCGEIPDDAVASAHMAIEKDCPTAELLMAVWHHSIEGGPDADDYMDVGTAHRMIGNGVRLGLHGHQHRAEISYRYVLLPEEERMAVVSAGSLCAGQEERPTGTNRQYNVITLDDDLGGARIHVREMAVATVFGPSMRAELGGKGYVDMSWRDEGFLRQAARAIATRRETAVFEAEAEWKTGNPQRALALIRGLPTPLAAFERKLLMQLLQDTDDQAGVRDLLDHPQDADELALLIDSLTSLHDFAKATGALETWGDTLGLPGPQVAALAARITALEAITSP